MGDLAERLRAEVMYDELNEGRTNMLHEERLFDEAADRIDALEAALPLLVASPSLKERASIARRALEADDE